MTAKKKIVQRLKNRILEMRSVKASELQANERNWRLHPEDQRGGLSALLEDVGFVQAVVARETKDGLQIIDGHLRADIAGDEEIPVIIVDLTDEEAEKVLLTFDPLGELAKHDSAILGELIDDVNLDDNAYTRKLIQDMTAELEKEEKKANKAEKENEHNVPDLELQPHEHYDYLVVLATNTAEWNVLCERLGMKASDHPRRKRMGIARAVHAHTLLALMKDDD